MIRSLMLFALLLISAASFSQTTGDTIVVQAYNWNSPLYNTGIRDTTISFPTNPGLTYEKILMMYNIRCRDASVNTTGGNYVACGEWDYSCNTYIHDSSRVDSTLNFISSHNISNFTGTTYNYTTTPTNSYYTYIQQDVTVNNIISETMSTIGSGSLVLNHTLPTTEYNGKSMYLFTQAELATAGVTAGDLDGLMLNVFNAGGTTNFLRVRLKQTTQPTLDLTAPELTGFSEVYFDDQTFAAGLERLQFHTPFVWDGVSNILVEFSFTNPSGGGQIEIVGNDTGNNMGMYSSGDRNFVFNGVNYLESDTYKGIGGSADRTVEAWINSEVNNKEIVSWGRNSATEKWVFRINNDGTLRVEVNGGNRYGTTTIDDGEWHHVACVFSGSDCDDVLLYVDGNLETIGGSASEPVNTNIVEGINLRVSRGTNERYFDGIIDEVRVWSAALSQTELQNWMYRSIDNTHPDYANLETYFPLNEGTGTTITDASVNNENSTVMDGDIWSRVHGVDLFKEMNITTERPNLTFLQGTYDLTIVNDTIFDTIPNIPNSVVENTVFPNYGTTQDDSIGSVVNTYWEATYHYIYDENSVLQDSIPVATEGTINVTTLPYYRRFPMRFEIASVVTPYGINLNLGQEGVTWKMDLTDFTPILTGDKRLTIERGGQWQEEMDIKFLFIVGTPPRDVVDVQQLWRNDSKGYAQILSDEVFELRSVSMNANAEAFKIRSAITGHGQEGEFIPRMHHIDIDAGGALEYEWQVWKECAINPIYPQGGTWIYDRAGWCPGEPTDLQEFDITPHVTPGQTHMIDYGLNTASGSSNYIVNNQLVSYGAPNFTLDASAIDITQPTDYIEYARKNSICTNPIVRIRNTGSENLTSLTIEYWINDDSNRQTYNWTGNLSFLSEELVELPSPAELWNGIGGLADNEFHVEISAPNGGTDEYSYNNKANANFTIPDVVPSNFYINFKSNNAPNETKYELFDEAGNLIFERSSMSANTVYKDTFDLGGGCYQFVITDTGDDGISFWANSDGNGYAQFRGVGSAFMEAFEPDFGGSFIYNFTIDWPLSYDELYALEDLKVYPNPAVDQFTLEADNITEAVIQIFNNQGQKIELTGVVKGNSITYQTEGLTSGIYLLRIEHDGKVRSENIIID